MDTFKLRAIYMYVVILIIMQKGLVLRLIHGLSTTECYKEKMTRCPYSESQCEGWTGHPQTCNTAESMCQSSIDDCMITSDSEVCQPVKTRIELLISLPILLTCDVPSTLVYINNIEYVRFNGNYSCGYSNYQGQCTSTSCETVDCCPLEIQSDFPDTRECRSSMQQNIINNFNYLCEYESLNRQCTISIPQQRITTCDQVPDLDVDNCTQLHGTYNATYCWSQRVNVNYACKQRGKLFISVIF